MSDFNEVHLYTMCPLTTFDSFYYKSQVVDYRGK